LIKNKQLIDFKLVHEMRTNYELSGETQQIPQASAANWSSKSQKIEPLLRIANELLYKIKGRQNHTMMLRDLLVWNFDRLI